MATTILLALTALMALVTLFWAAVILVHVYYIRRIIHSDRFKSIKTLYGLHFQRRAFAIAGKR